MRALITLIWVAVGSGRVQCGTVELILHVIVRAHLLMSRLQLDILNPELECPGRSPYLLFRGGFNGFSICRASSTAQDSREPSRTHTRPIMIQLPA